MKQDMVPILLTNWKVWIPFQIFNFNVVPVKLQVRWHLPLHIPALCAETLSAFIGVTKFFHCRQPIPLLLRVVCIGAWLYCQAFGYHMLI